MEKSMCARGEKLEGRKLYSERERERERENERGGGRVRAILVITSVPRGNLNCCEPNMQNFRPFSYSGQSGSPIPSTLPLLPPSRICPRYGAPSTSSSFSQGTAPFNIVGGSASGKSHSRVAATFDVKCVRSRIIRTSLHEFEDEREWSIN